MDFLVSGSLLGRAGAFVLRLAGWLSSRRKHPRKLRLRRADRD